jgi:hypothetical protein
MDYVQWDAEVAVRMPFTAGLDFDIERVIYEGRLRFNHGAYNSVIGPGMISSGSQALLKFLH